jgi:protein SCO1/2
MQGNSISASPEKRKFNFRFWVVLFIFVGPALTYIILNNFTATKCKPLLILRNEDSTVHTIPNFRFLTQNAKVFTQDSLKKTYHVANFIFTTCPGICIPLSKKFTELQEKIKDSRKVRLISYSVDPSHDTPEVLQAYAQKHKAIPGKWIFLTGNEDEMFRIVKDGYKQAVLKTPEGKERITHSEHVVLVDKDLRIRGFYNILDGEIGEKEFKRLTEEINVLDCEYREKEKK